MKKMKFCEYDILYPKIIENFVNFSERNTLAYCTKGFVLLTTSQFVTMQTSNEDDNQVNYTLYNTTQHNNFQCDDLKHNGTQFNFTHHSNTQHNDNQYKDIKHKATQCRDTQHKNTHNKLTALNKMALKIKA